jgi:hypothetical protein
MSTSKNPINWKVAMAGGGLFGLGVGGFAFAGGTDNNPEWPPSVLLQETDASVLTPSRPVVIPPTTTAVDSVSPVPVETTVAPVPAPPPDTTVSPAPVAPAPVAPAPVAPAPEPAPIPAPAPDPSVSASPAPASAPAPDPSADSWSVASPPSGGGDDSSDFGSST